MNAKKRTGYWTYTDITTGEECNFTKDDLVSWIKTLVEDEGQLDGDFAEWIDEHEEEMCDFWYDFVVARGDMQTYYNTSLDMYAEELVEETFIEGKDAELCRCPYKWHWDEEEA